MTEFTPIEVKLFNPGTLVFSRYHIVKTLGWGGMGLVLKATDTALNNEPVALKILYQKHSLDEDILARFRREVVLSRKLSHPNIVRVYDFGKLEDGSYFISMEYVEGKTLKDILDAGPIEFSDAVKYLRHIAHGLSYAHSQEVIHRDIKPENMLVTADGVVKISDFGVARSLVSDEKLTKTDEAVGSPVYISPEMLQVGTIDHRTDIYGLGILAYELVEGVPPFYSDNWVVIANMHLKDPIPPFKSAAVPYWFKDLVNKATEKRPEKRFQTTQAFLNYLDSHTGVKSAAENNSAINLDGRSLGIIALVVFIILGLAGLLLL